MLRWIVVFAAAAAATSTTPVCNASAFVTPLDGKQCFGLAAGSATTLAACEAACCEDITCTVFLFCPAGITCDGWPAPGPTCWTGAPTLADCLPRSGWQGAARPLPPRPPRVPQAFLAPHTAEPTAPLATLDLGALAVWSLSVDGGAARGVSVPGGGYNSDQQARPFIDSLAVKSSVVYSLPFVVPPALCAAAASNSARLRLAFGAVNHGAEVYVTAAGNATPALVGAHYGPNMAFDVDATSPLGAACGSAPVVLTVVARPIAFFEGDVASGFSYGEAWQHPASGFASRQCGGICKYVTLVAVAAVRVAGIVARTSVASQTVNFEVTVANDGGVDFAPGALALVGATLSSWNAVTGRGTRTSGWPYPALPASIPLPAVPARASEPTTINVSVPWTLGPASLWWPNRPHNDSYAPQLHFLNLTLATAVAAPGGAAAPPPAAASQRFGTVELLEGSFFYTLNGVRLNQLSDATPENGASFYDQYAQPASFGALGPGAGAHETWSRYMRLGITSNRIHQSTPTQAMLDAADEAGFLLKPETPVRGCPGYMACNVSSPLLRQSVAELVAWCRAHPSVVAYSVENESGAGSLLGDLIDAAAAARPGVPLTTEGSGGEVYYNGTASAAHAVNMLHYAVPDHSRELIRGVGECAWCVKNGLESFSGLALAGRLDDVAYYSGWDILNYWPNFLVGMNASLHVWKQVPCNGSDRVDGVDGWGSPVIHWVQRAFAPFLVADVAAVAANPTFTGPGWPYNLSTYTAGQPLEREVALYNDVLSDAAVPPPWDAAAATLSLAWAASWDAPGGAVVASGGVDSLPAPPGAAARANVSIAALPDPGAAAPPRGRRLCFVLSSLRAPRDAQPLGVEDRVCVLVQRATAT